MSREAAKTRPTDAELIEQNRKQSGTRRIVVDPADDDSRSSSVQLIGWPDATEQDKIPTQPASDPPSPPSEAPPPNAEPVSMTLDLPPPSYEEVRDTIPAPPPDHAD